MIDLRRRTDSWVVSQVLSGQRSSFGALVERYQAMVYHVALAHVGNPADAEDLTQEAFLKAFCSIDKLRDARKFSSWIATITRNVCRDFLKRRSVERKHSNPVPESDAYGESIEDAEARRVLWRHIGQLEEMQRELLVLHHFEGKSARELAKMYDISTAACAKRIQRARQALGTKVVQSLGNAAEQEEPKDLSKRVMGVVTTTSVTWETAAAASTPALALAGAYGLYKAGAGLLVVVSIAVGAVFATREQQPQPRTFETGEADSVVVVASLEEESTTVTATATAQSTLTTNTEVRMDGDSGRYFDPRSRGGGEIRGQVLDALGNPVPGVPVVIDGMKDHFFRNFDESESRLTQTTDEEGAFEFTDLPAPYRNISTTYQVLAFGDGTAAVAETHITAPGAVKTLALRLTPSDSISGAVVDASGQPVAGARVYPVQVRGEEHYEPFRAAALRTLSNAEGLFTTRGLALNDWKLVVVADGFATARTDFVVPGTEDVRIQLTRGGSVRGQVVDLDGAGVAYVQMRVMESSPDESHLRYGWNTRYVTTDESGHYRVENLEASEYGTMLASLFEDTYIVPPNGIRDVRFSVAEGDETLAPTLEVARGGEVGGRVSDPVTGEGMNDVTVTILINRRSAPVPDWTKTRTDAEGRYRFAAIPAGEHRLYLEEQRQNGKTVVTKHGEIINDADFVHINSAWVAGAVVDALGNPVSHAVIRGSRLPSGNQVYAVTDLEGRYEIRGLEIVDVLVENGEPVEHGQPLFLVKTG